MADTVVDKPVSFFDGQPPLSVGVGWAICLGFGVAFSVFTTLLVWLDAKFAGTTITSEQFNTAGRSVKTGLIAAVVCSQWTWAATLLQSSNVAWEYGVSGPYWYGAGACVQILLFGILSIEIKRRAPAAHTVCEIIMGRWGKTSHQVFLFFCLLTNVLVTAMLLLGGAATITATTGLNTALACFLIPLGIIVYTMADGLKATFLSNYVHTIILHSVLVAFVLVVYAASPMIGSVDAMHKLLGELVGYSKEECSAMGLTACGPVDGNKNGSYLTMWSSGGAIFALINVVGNFGTVFLDQAYWQSAIAARPTAAVKGYLLGGLCWFAIPFALATSLGLACLALKLPITKDEANAGLVPIAASMELMGTGGAACMVLMVFMAVTSCGSAELIAVSSLLTYDIYKTYINPNASGKRLLYISRACVGGFGIIMGALAVLLQYTGLDLGYLYLLMGVLVGSAVFPVASCLLWDMASATSAISGAVGGAVCAIITWLCVAYSKYGEITLKTTGESIPMLAGNLVAILGSGVIMIVVRLVTKVERYDWEGTKAIGREKLPNVEGEEQELEVESEEAKAEMMDDTLLANSKKFIVKWGSAFSVLMLIVWPLLALPAGAPFPVEYFGLWVGLGIAWGIISTGIITFLPLYESKDAIMKVVYGLYDLATGSKGKKVASTGVEKTLHLEMSSSSVDWNTKQENKEKL